MAVFSPQMESQIYYERPTPQPKGGSVLGDVFGIAEKLTRTTSTTGGGTSDQRFDKAWSSYEELLASEDDNFDAATFSPATASRSQLNQFGQLFGESLKNKALTYAREQKNNEVLSYEAAIEGRVALDKDWLSSAEYAVVQGTALRLQNQGKEEEAYLTLEQARTDWMTRKATSARLSQEAQNVTDLTKLSNDAWEVNKKAVRATTDFASYALSELLMALKATPNAEINLKAELGDLYTLYPNLTTEIVTRDNFSEFASQLKSEILRGETNRISGEVQFDLRSAPTGYENEVFGTIDAVIAWAEKDLDPAEIVKRGQNDAYLKMKEAGLPVDMLATIDIFSQNPAIQTEIINGFTPDIIKFIQDYKQSGSAAAQADLQAMSTQDIKDAFKHFTTMIEIVSGRSSDAGVFPEVTDTEQKELLKQNIQGFWTCVDEARNRNSNIKINKNVYEQCIEPNSADIVQMAAKDGEFSSSLSRSIAKDIEFDIAPLKTQAMSGVTSAAEFSFEINDSNQIVYKLGMESVTISSLEDVDLQVEFLLQRRSQFEQQELNALEDTDKDRFQIMKNDAQSLAMLLRNNKQAIAGLNYKLSVLSQLGPVSELGMTVLKNELGIELPQQEPPIVSEELPDVGTEQITIDNSAEVGTRNNPHNLTTEEQVNALPAGDHFTFAGSVDGSGNLIVYVK